MAKGRRLQGALAIVTGASSGIGQATARLLAVKGARVVLLARNQERLSATAAGIRAGGGKANSFAVDLADANAIAATVAAIVSDVGVPDILVNSAGAGRWLPLVDTSAEEASQMMGVPYLAAFNLTREFLPGMLERGSGHIVNVTSVASRLAWPGAVAYSASRRAMEGFTEALRADLYASGVGVTLAILGTVDSAYWEHNPGSRERLPARAAQIRPLTPEQAAAAIVAGTENGDRVVVKPAIFRLLFWLNTLFPARTEAMMCRRS